jgi:hypothetical protein
VKKLVSKADLRRQLRQETERFLRQGGRVSEIPQGMSGREAGDPPLLPNRRLFIEPSTPRTLVPEVVAAIEARRREKYRRKPPLRRKAARPRRKVIYDDFGEPLRRIWLDD